MASQPPLVTQADLDAYIASYQKAQADQAAALAAAQATGMSDQYTQLYGGMDIVPGMTQGILSNLGIENPYVPVYSLIGSESVGNNLANERMQFAPTPGVSYRLVNNATGETTTATTPEEIKALIAQSNALSASGGKRADLSIESNQTGAWSPVFTDAPNPLMDTITKIALAGIIASTGAGLLQPGGLGGVGAAGTSGAAGAGTAAGATGAAAGLAPAATVAAAVPAATAATSDLVITALMAKGLTAAQAAALVATGGAAAALSSSAGAGTTTGTTAASNATNTMPPATTTGPDLLLTAQQTGSAVPAVVPAAAAATTAAATSGSSAANAASDAAISQNTQNAVDTAYQNAQTGAASDLAAAGYNGMGAGPFVAPGAGATVGGGVFGTGLSLAQLASITGIGVDLLGKLIGGGGDEGATTPYTSPFGAGPTFAPAARTQINPNIADYEKYGFGPEAMFFSAGQTNPGAVAAPTTTTTTGATTGQTGVISQPRMTNTTNDDVTVPATTAPTLLPNMVSSLGPTATSAQIEGALANAKTAQEATKINPGTVYYNIDTATADALGDRGLIGDVMSIQQLQQAMAARELTDPNKFATNLFQQIGEQYNKGVLNIDQARAIQQQIQQEQARTGASTQNMQNIFNTAMQQYKPLI